LKIQPDLTDGALSHSDILMPFPDSDEIPGGNTGIRIYGASVRGGRHEQSGQPCQDAYAVAEADGIWAIAIADGLGSADHADTGARIAVDTASHTVLESTDNTKFSPEERIRQAFLHARDAVIAEADLQGIPPGSCASTLIVAFYFRGQITIGHIGDGIAIGIRDRHVEILSSPGESEYANETACLVQSDWESQLRITLPHDIDHAIIATDGCQGALAIRRGGNYQPHEPFVLPLISFIAKKIENRQNPEPDISALLASKRMQDLSGDDKTLVVLFGHQQPLKES